MQVIKFEPVSRKWRGVNFFRIKFHYKDAEPGDVVEAETSPIPCFMQFSESETIEIGKYLSDGKEPERWDYYPACDPDGRK